MEIAGLAVSILLAISGYLFAYFHKQSYEARSRRLDLIDRQINEFYGPLYVLTQTSSMAIRTLRSRRGGLDIFKNPEHPTDSERSDWRAWMETVLMPINLLIEDLIRTKAHLVEEQELPQCLTDFLAHSSIYKVILSKWQNEDCTELASSVPFPHSLPAYAKGHYDRLKAEQARLMGKLKPRG